MRLFSPVQVMMGLVSGLSSARVSLARIFELFDTPAEVTERPEPLALDRIRHGISLEGVGIAHAGRQVLAGLDLAIPRGAFCAVLGASGAGKSTLADLLVRQLDPDGGRILIDGHDMRDLRLADLRRAVILVDQSPHLFNDTIGANIGFARPGATREDIMDAAQLAGLGPLLARLPQGLDTRGGERGLALSAGERQRVALARALLRKPQVLILDEPTAALDSETERQVALALRRALPDATIVAITHKPLLADMADIVVTIEAGCAQVRAGAGVAA
jgi:ATP-binding cassette subfamily B protein